MNRPGTHPIAWTQCAVDFGPGEQATLLPMRNSLRAQRQRAAAQRKARKERPLGTGLALWAMPHAVSLTDPFATACGQIYNFGTEVPVVHGVGTNGEDGMVTTFEGLHIGIKCRGCAGAIGADPQI